jgi:hypothetical protein
MTAAKIQLSAASHPLMMNSAGKATVVTIRRGAAEEHTNA